jgi:hypothetical protein
VKKTTRTKKASEGNRVTGRISISVRPFPKWVVHWLLSCAGILRVFGLLTEEERRRVVGTLMKDLLNSTRGDAAGEVVGRVTKRPGKKGRKS